jgi:uncharacterized protein (TIGR02594 family)
MKVRSISSPPQLAAVAAVSIVVAMFATPASARSRHHTAHHAYHHRHTYHRYRHAHHSARWDAFRARAARTGADNAYASMGSTSGGFGFGGGSSLVAEARRYIGRNPTSRSSLWCARFMNFVLQRTGHRGTGSDAASSFAHYGQRVSGPEVGAIAVMHRHGGGHVGVVSGIDAKGDPIIISGNHGHRVAESVYQRGRIYAYVMPTG